MELDPTLNLVTALSRLPRGEERGFRFIKRDRSEHYYPYEKLEAEAHRRAAHLRAMGLDKGDKIALVIPEPDEFVLTFLGAACAGVVPVPIYPRASFKNAASYVDVLAHIIRTAHAKVVVCMKGNMETVKQVPVTNEDLADIQILDAEEAFVGEPPAFSPPVLAHDDVCFLQFTSGSTSKPKGVVVTHGNLVANTTSFLGPKGLDRRPEDIFCSWLPLYHDMGLIGFVLSTLIHDIPGILMPTETFARSPRLWLDTITKHKATITYAPNFAYDLVHKRIKDKHLPDLDLSSVRVAGSGAEPIRPKTLRAFADKFGQAGFPSTSFLPSYGMAEATLAITFHQVGTEIVVDRVDAEAMQNGDATPATGETETVLEVMSCGEPFPGHEVAVVDDAGNPLPERKVGQVVTTGPSITPGYYLNEDATNDAFRDGWLQTGDLGYFADGNLYICGRIKDLIIIRGANHYPQDIEWSVGELDGVRRGNVFAFSVTRDGEEQLVVMAEANRADAERLRTEIKRRVQEEFGLSPSHVGIIGVGNLPKTSSGKAQRRKTKQMFEAGEFNEHP